MRKLLVFAVLSLAGCAKGAQQVVPAAVPTFDYERMSCADLGAARARNLEALASLSVAQEKTSSNDAFGVMLIGLPVASMTGGDHEADLAVAKGRDLSIQSVQQAKNCPS